ncbi:13047_t:CDS:2, partial [Acaulospora morrowiae]
DERSLHVIVAQYDPKNTLRSSCNHPIPLALLACQFRYKSPAYVVNEVIQRLSMFQKRKIFLRCMYSGNHTRVICVLVCNSSLAHVYRPQHTLDSTAKVVNTYKNVKQSFILPTIDSSESENKRRGIRFPMNGYSWDPKVKKAGDKFERTIHSKIIAQLLRTLISGETENV